MIIFASITAAIVASSWVRTLLDGKYESLYWAIVLTIAAAVGWGVYFLLGAL